MSNYELIYSLDGAAFSNERGPWFDLSRTEDGWMFTSGNLGHDRRELRVRRSDVRRFAVALLVALEDE